MTKPSLETNRTPKVAGNLIAFLVRNLVRLVVIVMVFAAPTLFGFPDPFHLAMTYACKYAGLSPACAVGGGINPAP